MDTASFKELSINQTTTSWNTRVPDQIFSQDPSSMKGSSKSNTWNPHRRALCWLRVGTIPTSWQMLRCSVANESTPVSLCLPWDLIDSLQGSHLFPVLLRTFWTASANSRQDSCKQVWHHQQTTVSLQFSKAACGTKALYDQMIQKTVSIPNKNVMRRRRITHAKSGPSKAGSSLDSFPSKYRTDPIEKLDLSTTQLNSSTGCSPCFVTETVKWTTFWSGISESSSWYSSSPSPSGAIPGS